MKWAVFVVVTIACWGAYVPMLHQGQTALGRNSALRAFLFVGAAYAVVSGFIVLYLLATRSEPLEFTLGGGAFATAAGVLGALGALGIVFALKGGGRPISVAPLVFAGAPVVNTMVSMIWHRPARPPGVMFFVGIILAAAGAALVLRHRPL